MLVRFIHNLAIRELIRPLGFRSIINPHRSDEMEVWSMAFESQSPRQLASDHERHVKEIYGPDAWTQG